MKCLHTECQQVKRRRTIASPAAAPLPLPLRAHANEHSSAIQVRQMKQCGALQDGLNNKLTRIQHEVLTRKYPVHATLQRILNSQVSIFHRLNNLLLYIIIILYNLCVKVVYDTETIQISLTVIITHFHISPCVVVLNMSRVKSCGRPDY